MIKMQLGVTTRLTFIKNILAVFLIATLAFTWPLWASDRFYPLFPGIERLPSLHVIAAYAIPSLLIFSLLMSVILVRPRFFIFLAALLCVSLLLLDAGRIQYWFYFYILLLVILLGYSWRVDNINHYMSTFNAIRIVLAAVYLLAAIQHFQSGFVHEQWPAFIKPFERFWTPEQCAYLLKIAYVVPFIELFIVIGLFLPGAKIAAISFSVLFHLFSLVVLCLQPQAEPAVICWHLAMISLVLVVFAGNVSGQKAHGFAFGVYPIVMLLLFGLALPLYFSMSNANMKNRIDLMQANNSKQYIYISEAERNKLPLYIQSFALERQDEHYKLNVTSWSLCETKTKQVLGVNHLVKLTAELNRSYGAEALVALPVPASKNAIALK